MALTGIDWQDTLQWIHGKNSILRSGTEPKGVKDSILSKQLLRFVNLDQRGWINVGMTRMALIDILQGFYKISAIFRNEVGEKAPYVIYEIAKEAGTSFHEPLLNSGSLKAEATGFRGAVRAYSEAGFGDFQIKDLNWKRGWA